MHKSKIFLALTVSLLSFKPSHAHGLGHALVSLFSGNKRESVKNSKPINLDHIQELNQNEKAFFTIYMENLQRRILSNWDPAEENNSLIAKAKFDISPDGRISNLKMIHKSGSPKFDETSLRSIIASVPFDPISKVTTIEFTFDYSLKHRNSYFGQQLKPLLNPYTGYSLEHIENLVPKIKHPKQTTVQNSGDFSKQEARALPQSRKEFKIALPVDCELGTECFIFMYPDQAPGKEAQDFRCGRMSNDGLGGTSFALKDEQKIQAGIPVLAVADGEILRMKDGMPDIANHDDSKVAGEECGNAVIIKHADNWQSQYCHLRNGSIKVKAGDQVKQGEQIAFAGESGRASFPQAYFEIRKDGHLIDPFKGYAIETGCTPIGREFNTRPLWKDPLEYKGTGLVSTGVTDHNPEFNETWSGKLSNLKASKNDDALIFWAQSYGVLAGDIEEVKIYRPDGSLFTSHSIKREKPYRNAMIIAGRRNSNPPFMNGQWKAIYTLEREHKKLTEKTTSFTVE